MSAFSIISTIDTTVPALVVGLGATVATTVAMSLAAAKVPDRWLRWLAWLWAVWIVQYAMELVTRSAAWGSTVSIPVVLLVLRETLLVLAVRDLGVPRALWYWAAGLLPLAIGAAFGLRPEWLQRYAFLLLAIWWGLLTVMLVARVPHFGGARVFAALGTGLHAVILLVAARLYDSPRYMSIAVGLMAAVHFSVGLGLASGAREMLLQQREEVARRVAKGLEYVVRGLVPMCAYCHSVRDGHGHWRTLTAFVAESTAAPVADVLCPTCRGTP